MHTIGMIKYPKEQYLQPFRSSAHIGFLYEDLYRNCYSGLLKFDKNGYMQSPLLHHTGLRIHLQGPTGYLIARVRVVEVVSIQIL